MTNSSPPRTALSTLSSAILETAPGLFSTTIGAPSALDKGAAKTHATKTAAPPGAKPTTSLTGREGYDCASAWLAKRKTRQKILISDTIARHASAAARVDE